MLAEKASLLHSQASGMIFDSLLIVINYHLPVEAVEVTRSPSGTDGRPAGYNECLYNLSHRFALVHREQQPPRLFYRRRQRRRSHRRCHFPPAAPNPNRL